MGSIGRLLDRGASSISPLIARTGGIRPPGRRRSRRALRTAEREEISRELGADLSFRTIARQLRRAPSAISREERGTRHVMPAKVSGRETGPVVTALAAQIEHSSKELRQTLTWGRGKALTDHKSLTLATDLDVYLRDPHSPWQRGTNENTNRLLRQCFPKGTDLCVPTQEHLDAVARELNEHPGKTSNSFSPAEKFEESVASTG